MGINRFQVLVDALKPLSEIDESVPIQDAVLVIFENYTKNWNAHNYQESNYKRLYYKGLNRSAAHKLEKSGIAKDKFKDYINEASYSQKESISKYLLEKLQLKEEIPAESLAYYCVNLMSELVEEAKRKKQLRKQKIPTKSEDKDIFTKTVSDETFTTVFRQVNASEMDAVKNRNIIHAFVLKPELLPFSYTNLKDLVTSNITSYAIARGVSKTDVIGLQAANLLRKYAKSGIPNNLLGELLAYIFLEHEDNALKLYTRAEILKVKRTINSEGIYLKRDQGKTQLILGASQLNNNLEDAINNVVKKIATFDNNRSNEMVLATDIVDRSILRTQFGEDKSNAIIKLMAPTETGFEDIASYGIFIGYKFRTQLDLDDCTQEEAKEKCRQAINCDLEQAIRQLNIVIQQHHWQKSSFYVYLLPFTNAEEDTHAIMKDLIGE
ncbi:HamA C-terminal domain-containing protein [Limosilactobacillus fermentum]